MENLSYQAIKAREDSKDYNYIGIIVRSKGLGALIDHAIAFYNAQLFTVNGKPRRVNKDRLVEVMAAIRHLNRLKYDLTQDKIK